MIYYIVHPTKLEPRPMMKFRHVFLNYVCVSTPPIILLFFLSQSTQNIRFVRHYYLKYTTVKPLITTNLTTSGSCFARHTIVYNLSSYLIIIVFVFNMFHVRIIYYYFSILTKNIYIIL